MRQDLDTETLGELFARTRRPLFSYAAAVLLDRAAAEDVVQRTFEVAIARRHAFRPGLGSAEAWLYLASVQLLARRLARSGYHS